MLETNGKKKWSIRKSELSIGSSNSEVIPYTIDKTYELLEIAVTADAALKMTEGHKQ